MSSADLDRRPLPGAGMASARAGRAL